LRDRGTGWIGADAFGAVLLVLAGVTAASPARAHPHVFIDGGVDFVFDADGRLAQLRVTWIYDPLTSLFMLEDLGIDPGQPLADADRPRLAQYDTEWDEGYDGDSYLWDGDHRVGLSEPRAPEADLRDGKVTIRFLRDLAAPFRPAQDARVEVYDPTYYMAYTITDAPRLEGAAEGCSARVEPFAATDAMAPLLQSLLALPADATPEQDDVGALLAEKVHLTCD
jgi:ABC-type uncharacterized transport system substrate-binding protein